MPLHEHPAPITGVIPGKRLLDVVDLGELADGGLGSIVRAVVHNELAGSDLGLQSLVLVLGEGLEVPAVISSGQTDVVAVLQTEVAVGSSDVAPLASLDVAQSGADRLRQALHGRGDERVVSVAVLLNAISTDVVLVNVNAHNVAVVLQSSLDSGGVDAAAAGKDDLSAVGIPALHTGGDVGIAVELAAVEVVDVNVGAQLLCSSVSALHVAVAVTDNGGHSHAAQEAQLGVAVLNNGVTCQIACLLLLEGTFKEEQAGYLAGYAVVKDGYTKLGFLGGMAVPAVIRYGYGYVQGADAAAKELGTNIDINYFYGGQFYGDANITSRMEGWYANGTQIVFACGGGIYTSAVEAALKNNGYVVGVDVDQNYIGANGVEKDGYAYNPFITSAMKGLSESVSTALGDIEAGEWSNIAATNGNFGLEDGDYVGLPTADDSWNFKTFTKDEYETLKTKIASGELVVDNSSDDATKPTVSEFTKVNYIQ